MRTPLLASAVRTLAVTGTALAAALAAQHAVAAGNQVTMGFITDMSGLYADIR